MSSVSGTAAALIPVPSMSRNCEPKVKTTGLVGLSLFRQVEANGDLNQISCCELNLCFFSFKCLKVPGDTTQITLADCDSAYFRDQAETPVKTSSLASAILCSEIEVDHKFHSFSLFDFSFCWLNAQACSYAEKEKKALSFYYCCPYFLMNS